MRVAEAGGAGEDVADRWVTVQADVYAPRQADPCGSLEEGNERSGR
jgi:hypothetical protein